MAFEYDAAHIVPLEPGPRSHVVLTLQNSHRSEDIWHNSEVNTLKIHRSDAELWRGGKLDERVERILLATGFYGVYMTGSIQVDHALITALVERWRQETHTFHLPVGEATVTLEDVQVLWGLPVDGQPVTGRDSFHTIEDRQHVCQYYLGYTPMPEHFKQDRLKLTSISMHLAQNPLTIDSDDNEVHQHARCRLLQLIASIMPDKSGSLVKLMYLYLLHNLDEVCNYSWGSATLALLYRALCRASLRGTEGICGPVVLLQMWAWERIQKFRPQLKFIDYSPHYPDMPNGPRGSM